MINVDYRQMGSGSGSCGPSIKDSENFNEKTFSRNFNLVPGNFDR